MTVSERDTLLELLDQVQADHAVVYDGVSPLRVLKDYLERLLKTDEER